MASAIDVANFFVTMSEPDEGDLVTNLKVQKLCYYAQGSAIAVLGRVLFEEPILHWEHGPVVKSVYDAFKQHGKNAIPMPQNFAAEDIFLEEERELLAEVWDVYGQFSAWKLRNMTHAEPPWVNTKRDEIISVAAMKAYFMTTLVS